MLMLADFSFRFGQFMSYFVIPIVAVVIVVALIAIIVEKD